MIFVNEYIVYCKEDNTYLNSFDENNYWKKDIKDAEIFNLEENFKNPEDIVDSLFLDKSNIVLMKKINNKWLEINNNGLSFQCYILDYKKFLKVKEEVKKNKKYNDFYVYLIYSILKNKSFYKIINIKSKNFFKTFRKILSIKNNPEKFEYICDIMNIEKKDYYKAIKGLESELKK
tara:strand:- start:18328 stop:18855 length:528 start_codon:yes stop_codon:yes gene_type:complete